MEADSPSNGDPDKAHLLLSYPDPPIQFVSLTVYPVIPQDANHHLFEAPHKFDDTLTFSLEGEYGVAQELTRSVIGDIPSPFNGEARNALFSKKRLGDPDIISLSPFSNSEDMGMLHQKKAVRKETFPSCAVSCVLDGQAFLIVPVSQIDDHGPLHHLIFLVNSDNLII